jgi:hypothetical protein
MGSASTPEDAVNSLRSLAARLRDSDLAGEDLRREVVRSLESILCELRSLSGVPAGADPASDPASDPADEADEEDLWIAM